MPKILYLATNDWFFASHFLPAAKAAQDSGLEVAVAAHVDHHRETLEAAGCRVIALPIQRGCLGLSVILGEIVKIAGLIRREQPDIVHCLALRMVVLGGLAAQMAGARHLVLAVTGLGTLWSDKGAKSAVMRAAVRLIVRWLLWRGAYAIFENPDDPREFGLTPEAENVTILPGAGVNLTNSNPTAEPPAPPVKFAVLSRMLRTKGIAESILAIRRVRAEGAPVELHLFGNVDATNRSSYTENELRAFATEPGIFWHGFASDVAQVWRDHHVALLLTYREGLPRMLVEAAAAGRPIIATDVPGCREIVRDGIEGFLVPAQQTDGAAKAIRRLADDPALRQRMGAAANSKFRQGFTEAHVQLKLEALYQGLIGEVT